MAVSEIKPNTEQQACIDSIYGKYLVLAGPGTGKTFTLINRIVAMINKGIKGEKILCLTFSDAASREMKTRLSKALNKLDTGVAIYTYHSFCNDIISQNPTEFELSDNYKTITPAISRQFIKECIDELNPVEYRTTKNDPYVFLNTILSQIEEIKKNRLTKESYFKNLETNPDWKPQIALLEQKLEDYKLKNKKIPQYLPNSIEAAKRKVNKALEIWSFFELYKKKMEANHYIDYNDMINLVLEKFDAEPSFLDKVANSYDFILVDEYQDTNKSQNDIIFNLADALKSQNIFVVGDDDQIIYTFQGARLDTIEKFLEHYPDTKVICLKENMRSNQNILNAARCVIEEDLRRLEVNPKFSCYNISKELIAKNPEVQNNPVRLNRYYDLEQEYNDIVREIEELVNSPYAPKKLSEIAILTKSNSEAETFAKKLKDRNIPYELKEGKNIFEIKSSVVFYYYLRALINPKVNSDSLFKLLLNEPFNINPLDYIKLQQNKTDFIEKEKVENFLNTFKYLSRFSSCESLRDTVLEAGAKSGIFDYYLNCEINKSENIAGIKKILDEADDFSKIRNKITLEDFIEYLDISLRDDIPIKTSKAPVPLNAVQISTYHSSKGREFEYVYMPTLIKNYWESDNSSLRAVVPLDKSEYKTDDELKEMKYCDKIKLMYVGLTRAKHTLRLSYVQNINGKVKNPSAPVLNLENFAQTNDFQEYSVDTYWEKTKESIVKRSYDYKKDFSSFIDSYLNDRFFSPSAINTYLSCPREYLYNNILNLQSKYAYADALNYGGSFHKALEEFIKSSIKQGSYLNKDFLVEEFNKDFALQLISSPEKREILQTRAKNALSAFYNQLILTPIDRINSIEFNLREKEEPDYKFYGIIDRIDKNPDGTYSIYDYKTGDSKKINEVYFGEKNENYFIQIGLYKYFFEKATGQKVKDVTLVFPEDYTNNLTLKLTDEECLNIVKKFKEAVDNIKAHDFEPAPSKEACKYCPYKDFCALNVI